MNAPSDFLGNLYEPYEKLLRKIQKPDNNPDTIYHYTSASGLNEILRTSKLWFTRRDCLNDPTEHKHIHEIIDICLNKSEADSEFINHIRNFNNRLLECKGDNSWLSIDKGVFIASFSEDGNSIPLWMNYTKSSQYNGYCLGFDSKGIRKKCSSMCVAPVIYDDIKKENYINEFLNLLENIWNRQTSNQEQRNKVINEIQHTMLDFTSEVGSLFKDSCYAHEKEVRIILHAGTRNKNTAIRSSNGHLIPYIPVPFVKTLVKSIMSSPTLNAERACSGIRATTAHYGYKVEILHSTLPLRNV